jgi:hypothetical protein
LLQTPRTFLPAETVVGAATVFPCDNAFLSFIHALDFIYLAAEDAILTPTVWRVMKGVVTHYGTGRRSQRILKVPVTAGTRDFLVICLGREILLKRSEHGVPGANYNPDGSGSAFDDLNAFVNTVREVNQRYQKTLGLSVGTNHMHDRVGDAGAQMESSGREERARTDGDVQDAGRARRTQTGDDGHSDETARLPIVQTET